MHLPFRAFTFLSTAVIVYVASSMAAPILTIEQLHSGRLSSVGNSVPQSDVLQLKEIKLEAFGEDLCDTFSFGRLHYVS